MNIRVEFGKEIEEKRKNIGKTQDDCARACNVSRSGYRNWEKGVSFPSVENLEIICNFLGMSSEKYKNM